jgi:hypothetical protein
MRLSIALDRAAMAQHLGALLGTALEAPLEFVGALN